MLQAKLSLSVNPSSQFQSAADSAESGAYWQPEELLGLLQPVQSAIDAVMPQFATADLDEGEARSRFISAVDGALLASHPQAALAPATLRHAVISRVLRSRPRAGTLP